jgi:hypothetical protein
MPAASRAFASGRTVLDEIQIDPNSDISLRRQLVNQFIVQIAAGRLKGGQNNELID